MERQKFSPSILVLIKFLINLAPIFILMASVIYLFGIVKFNLEVRIVVLAIAGLFIGFILYLYYRMSIRVIIEDDRILVKKLFITRIDDSITSLKFDGFVSSGVYSDKYGITKILKSLFTPAKVRLVFSNGGSRIKIDASGLGKTMYKGNI